MRHNVLFMALSGDSAPQFSTIARFIRELAPQIQTLFTLVLLTCDAQGLTERMKQAIDSPRGRKLYSQRMATADPVFANIRHNKQLNRFTLRTQPEVNTQWTLYCLVHNIEKLAHGYARRK
jgi:hypothetical protein